MIITNKLPSSSSRTDPPDVLLEGMVGTPEDHIQALNEATTNPQEAEQDPANEGNDSTQVAAEKDYNNDIK